MILTDEDITKAFDDLCDTDHCTEMFDYLYARAIEAAVMAKFEVVMFYECAGCGHMAMARVTSCDCMSDLGIHEKQLYALKEKP